MSLKNKLLLLDLVLAVLVAGLAAQVRDRWLKAQQRSEVMLHQTLKPVPQPPYSALPAVRSVTAASYSAVAMKYPFSPDRNPTVAVEPPKEAPMPELPVYYGMMTLPDGETAIMSAKPGEPSEGIHFGEQVGEFTLLDIQDDEVTLEWNGKTVTKPLSALKPRQPAAHVAAARAVSESAQPKMQQTSAHVDAKPWDDIGPNLKACRPGDESPAGTESDGWRKVVVRTPMGDNCHWEK